MIRQCCLQEALLILNEPQNQKRIGKIADGLSYDPWIVEQGSTKMMFVYWPVNNLVYEMHIACPKDSIINSRDLAREAMEYVFSLGAFKIITNCPAGKISNMAKKLGMTEFKRLGKTIHYEVSQWELARQ
jgi:hypothetical protein